MEIKLKGSTLFASISNMNHQVYYRGHSLPGQAVHVDNPSSGLKSPALQGTHSVWATADWYWPAAQSSQSLEFHKGATLPTKHAAHTLAPDSSANRPGAQSVHIPWPKAGWYRPAVQY